DVRRRLGGVGVPPWVPARATGRRVEPGRLLPLGLGRQPPAGPGRVGPRLVPGHVHHRLGGRPPPRHPPHRAPPPPRPPPPAPPARGAGTPGPRALPPPRLAPPPRVVVPAVRDELLVRRVGDRRGVEVEGGHVHRVGGPLVVERPRLAGGAHGEGAAGHEHLG